jgi:uncharacterized protein with NRDE domain
VCTLLISINQSDDFPLVIAANRDEFLARPAAPMDWWQPEGMSEEVISGIDLEAGGTWMGMAKSGRIAAITNVRHPSYFNKSFNRSRGDLPLGWLKNSVNQQEFRAELANSGKDYSGYNFVFGNIQELHYYSNHKGQSAVLKSGLYGLSNDELDTPWPKVQWGKAQLQSLVEARYERRKLHDSIRHFMSSTDFANDDQLPDTGIGMEWEKPLSALNIRTPEYGTRVTTALTVDRYGSVFVSEFNQESGDSVSFDFELDSGN